MDTTQPVNHLSLCSGYEGIGLALSRVLPTCRTIAHVEIESFACANLVAKMEEGKLDPCPIWTNIKTFDGEPFRGLVDILSGGFPCQPFSTAGMREGDEDPRHLFPYIKNAIQAIQPRIVFLENVEGILSAKLKGDKWADPAGTPVLQHVLRELERVGYHATAGVFSAAEVGAPHQRKRVFILAHSRREHREVSSEWELSTEQITGGDGETRRAWPARPGEPQQEWEEPRVVADANSNESAPIRGDNGEVPQVSTEQGQEHCAVVSGGEGEERGHMAHSDPDRLQECPLPDEQGAKDYKVDGQSGRQTESQLGGATDGSASGLDPTANRVDRLRLLGNGVVPDTAEVAFRTLYKELMDEQQSNQS